MTMLRVYMVYCFFQLQLICNITWAFVILYSCLKQNKKGFWYIMWWVLINHLETRDVLHWFQYSHHQQIIPSIFPSTTELVCVSLGLRWGLYVRIIFRLRFLRRVTPQCVVSISNFQSLNSVLFTAAKELMSSIFNIIITNIILVKCN